ncbi:MAG: signal peptidase I [Ruminococcaceae bacterium]|nr:signal peptidase I [Oscillospiraceae bacterium]
MKKKLSPDTEVTETQVPGQENEPKKRDVKKIINIVVNVLLVVAIILAAVCTYVSFVSTSGNGVPSILGVRPFTVQTDSMYPTLKPGDLIIDVAVKDYRELRVGDIITYWTIIEGQRVLNTHKIAGIYDGGDYLIFETMGEKVNQTDVLTVHESEVVGVYKFRVPGVGKVLDYLQTPTGFMIVIVLPVLLFFVFHLVQFFRVLFEYQNVKMLIKYEQERGRTEDLIESQIRDEKAREEIRRAAMEKERAEMEAKLREELRAELLADMVKNNGKDSSDSGPQKK